MNVTEEGTIITVNKHAEDGYELNLKISDSREVTIEVTKENLMQLSLDIVNLVAE